jgi:membrane protein implicated in regulation of membrane protease activity
MEEHWIWFIAGLVILIAELFTGTFYMLVIAVALAAGGISAWLGGSFAVQFVLAAVVGFLGALILRKSRFGLSRREDTAADASVNMDIGNRLTVDTWDHAGHARVMYRGAMWDVVLEHGAHRTAGTFVIKEVRGSTLVVARHLE